MSYGTKHGTNEPEEGSMSAEVVEEYGRPEWTRTIDLPGAPGRSNQIHQ
jgi:hypothetical protein